jgi:hypothetical protein
VHLAEIEAEADDDAEDNSDGRRDESFDTGIGEFMVEDSRLPIEGEHQKKDERHGYEHLQTLGSSELEQTSTNGQHVVTTSEEALQFSVADDVVNEFYDNRQENDNAKVPWNTNLVECQKYEGHRQQAYGVKDDTGLGEDTDAGIHGMAHEAVVDDFLLVQTLLELGKLLAQVVDFVIGKSVIVCLSFHNCTFLIG